MNRSNTWLNNGLIKLTFTHPYNDDDDAGRNSTGILLKYKSLCKCHILSLFMYAKSVLHIQLLIAVWCINYCDCGWSISSTFIVSYLVNGVTALPACTNNQNALYCILSCYSLRTYCSILHRFIAEGNHFHRLGLLTASFYGDK